MSAPVTPLRGYRTDDLHIVTSELLPPCRVAQCNIEQWVMDTAIPRCLVIKLFLHLLRSFDEVDYIGVRRWFTHASALIREHPIVVEIKVRFHHSSDILV
jgi:hypothetical protein